MKRLYAIVFAIVLAAIPAVAMAGVVTIPITGVEADAPIDAEVLFESRRRLRIRTDPLITGLQTDSSDISIETQAAGIKYSGCLTCTVSIVIDITSVGIRGRSVGKFEIQDGSGQVIPAKHKGRLRGDYVCVGAESQRCQTMDVEMTYKGRLSRQQNGRRIGNLDLHLIGTLERNDDQARWIKLDGNGEMRLMGEASRNPDSG